MCHGPIGALCKEGKYDLTEQLLYVGQLKPR